MSFQFATPPVNTTSGVWFEESYICDSDELQCETIFLYVLAFIYLQYCS